MNKGTLPIFARLQTLQAPVRIAPGGGRIIAAITDPNPLAALLQEVNETVLGRSLTFESSGGSSLTLDVSGRRVLRVSAAKGLSGAQAILAVDALEDEHKDELLKLLQAVAAPRHEVRVTSTAMDRDTEGLSVGLPVALLADLLFVDLNAAAAEKDSAQAGRPERLRARDLAPATPAAPEDGAGAAASGPRDIALRRFVEAGASQLMAWLIVGEGEGSEGPEEMVQHLQGFLDDESEAVAAQVDQVAEVPNGPVCLILGATLGDGHSILYARSTSAVMLGVVEGDATLPLLQAWTAALT